MPRITLGRTLGRTLDRSHRRTARPASRRPRAALAAAALSLMIAACGGGQEAPAAPSPSTPTPAPAPEAAVDPITIVATTSILGDLVAELIGSDGTVKVLIPSGVDPHGYQASAADAAALRGADLVIANGLLLEEGLLAALDAAVADGVRVLTVGDAVDPLAFVEFEDKDDDHDHGHGHSHGHSHGDDAHDDDDDHDDHEHGEFDPHFWWDPMRTATAVELIATTLAELRPDTDWAARAAAYNTELMAVHDEMVALFATIPAAQRRIVTNHDSLGYLADRFGFEIIGTVIPGATTMAATNPRAFARLIDLIVAEGVSVVFAENTDSTVLAEQLASQAVGRGDVDVRVVRLYTDALGEPGSGAETYLGMLRTSAQLITTALTSS